jgi:hypothetical protein
LHTPILGGAWAAAALPRPRSRDQLELEALNNNAGCTDADLLSHLRAPGPHVRGCWAVDLVLGKS